MNREPSSRAGLLVGRRFGGPGAEIRSGLDSLLDERRFMMRPLEAPDIAGGRRGNQGPGRGLRDRQAPVMTALPHP